MEEQLIKNIFPEEAKNLLAEKKDISIIDVRSQEEYDSGHIENAVNFDIYSPDFPAKISGLPKEKAYLVYCYSGNRSGAAIAKVMEPNGFKELYNLDGGIAGWESKGYPIIK